MISGFLLKDISEFRVFWGKGSFLSFLLSFLGNFRGDGSFSEFLKEGIILFQ
jgi:hypothetical protein